MAERVRIGSVANAISANRHCKSIPIRNATMIAVKSCMNIESRLLKAALTNVASFANRMDKVSALFSSSSNQPTSLRSIAVIENTMINIICIGGGKSKTQEKESGCNGLKNVKHFIVVDPEKTFYPNLFS